MNHRKIKIIEFTLPEPDDDYIETLLNQPDIEDVTFTRYATHTDYSTNDGWYTGSIYHGVTFEQALDALDNAKGCDINFLKGDAPTDLNSFWYNMDAWNVNKEDEQYCLEVFMENGPAINVCYSYYVSKYVFEILLYCADKHEWILSRDYARYHSLMNKMYEYKTANFVNSLFDDII